MEDINTASVTQVIHVNGCEVTFPARYLELYFADYLDERGIGYTVNEDTGSVIVESTEKAKELANRLYAEQISATHAQHWYPLLPEGTTPQSVLIPLSKEDIQVLLDSMKPEDDLVIKMEEGAKQLSCKRIFIRLNSLSPKAPGNKFNIQDKEWSFKAITLLR